MIPRQQGWTLSAYLSGKVLTDATNRFYLGKKVAFVYRAHKEVRGTKIRVIWGKVTRPHGEYMFTLVLKAMLRMGCR